jgi:hypothetical protein
VPDLLDNSREEVEVIECFVALGVIVLICWADYKFGQQIGSRKGYGAGRAPGRPRI